MGGVRSDIRGWSLDSLCLVELGRFPAMVRLRFIDSQAAVIPDNSHRTLLEFRLDAESGALPDTVSLDVPAINLFKSGPLRLDGGQKLLARSRLLSIPNRLLIFDTRTRVFYEFPEFRVARVCRD